LTCRSTRVTAGAPLNVVLCQYCAVRPGPVPLAGDSTDEGTAVMSSVSIIDAALTGSLPGVKVTVAPDPRHGDIPEVSVPVVGDTYAEPLSAARMFASAPMTAMDFVEPVSGSTPIVLQQRDGPSPSSAARAACAL
jgi:hypothetical protein